MRSALLFSSIAIACFVVAASTGACGDDSGNATADAAASEGSADLCAHFTTSGDPCSPVSTQRCFPLCTRGGCFCTAAPSGSGGIWKCVDDESCYPDTGTITDDGGNVDTDGGTTADADADTNADGGDGGEGGDGSDDASQDASDSG
jgi:hypothetical protein